jgi:hypothetical protein
VNTTPIFAASWPHDLDPVIVPFTKRTATILQRQGIYTNPALLDKVTTMDVLGWWNAGPLTVDDLRITGNDAIRRHQEEAGLLEQLATDLSNMASKPWAPHIWWKSDGRYRPPLGGEAWEAEALSQRVIVATFASPNSIESGFRTSRNQSMGSSDETFRLVQQ